MTPEQCEKTVFVLLFGIQTMRKMAETATEEKLEESLASLTKLWESLLVDARQRYQQLRKDQITQNRQHPD